MRWTRGTTPASPAVPWPILLRWGGWWGEHLAEWVGVGIAGCRVLGLEHAEGALADLRRAAPGATLIAWTPGLPRAALPSLRDADYVVSSLPWWDGRADWFWDELAALRAIAPVLSCPEVPFGDRAALAVHDPALLSATLRRAAGLACALGGWLAGKRRL